MARLPNRGAQLDLPLVTGRLETAVATLPKSSPGAATVNPNLTTTGGSGTSSTGVPDGRSGTSRGASSAPIVPPSRPPPSRPAVSRTRLLEDAIKRGLGPGTRVVLTDTRSVLLSQSVKAGVRTVRVHQLFLDAPDEVREALGRFLSSGDRRAGRVIDRFIEGQDHLLANHAAPLDEDAHVGKHHDLKALFRDLNARYFEGRIDADITWGQDGSFRGRSRRSITLGTYDYRSKRITIHPVLDQPHVPLVCVARIIHHEMCHARHPAERSASGRRVVHGPAFRREEARFAQAREADLWFDDNLDALLRYRLKPRADRPKRG